MIEHFLGASFSAQVQNRFASGVEAAPLAMLPDHWFMSSEDLLQYGWPDFSVRALADWKSSVTPVPDERLEDCCVCLCFPRALQPIGDTNGWVFAMHETGGIWQEPKRIVVKRLPTAPRGSEIAHAIARGMAQTNVSAAFASFDQLVEYRRTLNEHGLDCNQHIQCLSEGFCPIDLSEEALSILEVASVPREALELMESEAICLAVLAPNCTEW